MLSLQPKDLHAFVRTAPQAVLLDVREPWELQSATIRLPQAQALDIRMQDVPVRLADLPRTQPIVCICHHGMRSQQVVAFLLREGYDEVYNLSGGIDAWSLQVDPGVPRY